jgi:hypothetical protein
MNVKFPVQDPLIRAIEGGSGETVLFRTITTSASCNVYVRSPLLWNSYIPILKNCILNKQTKKQTPWSEFASELYRPSDRRLSAKWLPTFADRGVPRGQRDGYLRPYSRFSRQEPLLFYQVTPQLYSRGWVDPVPDPLHFSGSAGKRIRASRSVAKNYDH